MMTEQKRQGLDLDALGLDDFEPRKPSAPAKPAQKTVAVATSFPSREAPDDDQLNIKGPKAVLDRFRALRKSERYKYADLLEFMMDAYEAKQKPR
ncbi:MAG: hypothetical protein KUA37_06205 [Desulfomicrobium sp.]|uniref:hypothetical protein n=1 Tax=Hoeflea sp. TaxID=1940281 RepID=UPI0025C4D8E8|nr:hypothetical protein [Hoeflea sp.]MBV1711584.1 hypothetical protein [Desulfomicrobium sp.]MBV1782308.1 hypothetical protein [Hoeflea sp.]